MKNSGISIGLMVCCLLILNVESFELNHKLDDWLKLFKDTNMFQNKNSKEKKVEYLKPINPSSESRVKTFVGQVGGLDTDMDGNLLIFHRGGRQWRFDSFFGNEFNKKKYGPIKEDTLTLINPETLKEIGSWGSNTFFMPHGLTIDFENNIWLTDVGSHQIYKFNLNDLEKPELVLGEPFKYGSDEKHFCKPTDVSVSSVNGDVFISDGYCNQRIVQLDKNGKFIQEYKDTNQPIQVAHSIALIENLNLVCTVSRQDGRIICFDIKTGEKKHELKDQEMKTVYAIEYDPNNELLHAATGDNDDSEAIGLTFYASKENFGELKQKWNSNERDLKRVHDLALSPDGSSLFLGQLNGEIDEFTYE